MASSELGIDHEEMITKLLADYRATSIAWDGEKFTEPIPAPPGSPPTDWIVPRIMRSDSRAGTVENDQWRDVRIGVWIAFQQGAGGKNGRRDAIASDLFDAFSLAKSGSENVMLDTYSFTTASAPPGLPALGNPWDWEAILFDAVNTEQA